MAEFTPVTLTFPPVGKNQFNPLAGESFPPGTPLVQSPSTAGTVLKAQADSADSASVIGFAVGPGNTGHRVHVQFAGPLTLTDEQWDVITGDTGGLVVGATYYLSASAAGGITATPPSGVGEYAIQVGIATGSDTMLIQVEIGASSSAISARTVEISPWTGNSDALPAGGNSGGPQLGSGQIWWVPVPINVGEQLNALTFEVFGNTSVDVAWGLFLFDYATNTNTTIASGTVTNPPAAWTPTTPSFSATPVAARQVLVFFFQPNAVGAFAGMMSARIGPAS